MPRRTARPGTDPAAAVEPSIATVVSSVPDAAMRAVEHVQGSAPRRSNEQPGSQALRRPARRIVHRYLPAPRLTTTSSPLQGVVDSQAPRRTTSPLSRAPPPSQRPGGPGRPPGSETPGPDIEPLAVDDESISPQ